MYTPVFRVTAIILGSVKLGVIRCGTYYDIDTDFLSFFFFDMKFMHTLRPLKIPYPQVSEDTIQMIRKSKMICLPTGNTLPTDFKAWKP